MITRSDWIDEVAIDGDNPPSSIEVFDSAGFLPPTHPAEADVFARQKDVPGHDQSALEHARILVVGAGGLGSWTILALARSGARHLTIIEPDRFARTNANRQLTFAADLRQLKALAVARNVVDHMVAGGKIVAIPFPFERVSDELPLPADLALFCVDNNLCRLAGSRFARELRIPAVFTMLSGDGLRLHAFLQGADENDACLHCALPNLDKGAHAPCAAATITSCLLGAAYATFFAHRAIMGWPLVVAPFNWREADLLGVAPERVGLVSRRQACPTCSVLPASTRSLADVPVRTRGHL